MNNKRELLQKCIDKDDRAIHELYRSCFSVMKRISMRYQQNDADVNEAINKGFLKVIQKLHTYNTKNSFEGWYKKILVHTNIDIYRSSKRHKERMLYVDSVEDFEVSIIEVGFSNKAAHSYESLLDLVKQLPPMTRQVFNLFAIDGYAHKEIGEMVSISVGTSKWHVSHARKKLKAALKAITENEKVAK